MNQEIRHSKRAGAWPVVLIAFVLAAPMADATAQWPMLMGDPARTGSGGTVPGPGTGAVLWEHEVPHNMQSPPAYANGRLFLGYGGWEAGGGIHALDGRTGAIDWKRITDPVHVSPVVIGKVLVVPTSRPNYEESEKSHVGLLGVDPATGALLWEREFAQSSATSPTLTNGTLYMTEGHSRRENATLQALDLATGETQWFIEARGHGLLNAGPHVVFADYSEVHVVDAVDGERTWSAMLEGADYVGPPSASEAVLVVPTEMKGVFGLDLASGDVLWNHNVPIEVSATIPVQDGLAFVGTPRGIDAVDIHSGEVHHTLPATSFNGLAIDGDIAYITEYTGNFGRDFDRSQFYVVAMDATTGQEYWRHHLDRFTYTPPIVVDGILYQTYGDWDEPGGVVALDAGYLASEGAIPNGEDLDESAKKWPVPGHALPLSLVVLLGVLLIWKRS